MIYHILSESEWNHAVEEGVYWPEELDQNGYIHCLTKEQLDSEGNTVSATDGIVLLEIFSRELESLVVLEDTNESGVMYPHVYGHINLSAVKEVKYYKDISSIEA